MGSIRIVLSCALGTLTAGAHAAPETYPARPIRIIVPFSAGSASDILSRLVGPKLSESWGQQVVVDNRPSAGGAVAGGIVAGSTPDGHTMMLTSSAFAGSAALYDKLPYDSVRDFSGVTQVASTSLVLVVSAGGGARSVKDLVAAAKQKPGALTFGSSGIGSGTHYGGELFRLAAGIDVVHVPYKGVPEVLNDVIAGRIDFSLMPVLAAAPAMKGGRLQALGVTSSTRLAAMPEVPTIAEAALPGFVYDGWFGVLVPSRTPRAVVDKLAAEIGRILRLPEVADRIAATGAAARPSSPGEFEKLVHGEIETRKKVFRSAGIKPN